MNITILHITTKVDASYTEYLDGDWNGADVQLADGGTLRVFQQGDDREDVHVRVYDKFCVRRWQAMFSYGTPDLVIAAAIRDAIKEG